MSDIKLFRYTDAQATELDSRNASLEKDLQKLMEGNLEAFLGVRFLASEYPTSKSHKGRIDSLGMDENNCPVIIEYKRHTNENVINQGLFYLDWLMEHQADFQLLVMEKLGAEAAKDIDWSAPRLLCIAGDFTHYDEYAVQQINRNIELIRYRLFSDDLLMLELVNAVETKKTSKTSQPPCSTTEDNDSEEPYYLQKSNETLRAIFALVNDLCLSLGEDVQMKHLKHYVAFKRLRNFVCVAFNYSGKDISIVLYLKVNPDDIVLEEGFTRDMREINHWGTGELEVRLRRIEDFERVKDWIEQSYHNS